MRAVSPKTRRLVTATVIVGLVAAMALSTRVVSRSAAAPEGSFSAKAFGEKQFPRVRSAITERATDAVTLAAALAEDRSAAVKRYAVSGGTGPEISVAFTGVVGAGESGIFAVTVPGVPASVSIRVQTGPAVSGTDLRDASGDIEYGQFVNQIDYQDAAAALNDRLRSTVLSTLDRDSLPGSTIEVVGAFRLIDPATWLVTPVKVTQQ